MRIFFIVVALMVFEARPAQSHVRPGCTSSDFVVCQILENTSYVSANYAEELAKWIHKSSKQHKVPARTLTAILGAESSFKLSAVREVCGYKKNIREVYRRACIALDFGIGQISIKTADVYGFDVNLLTTDLAYSIDASAEVLGWFRQTYARKEPKRWATRYNCGTRKDVNNRVCRIYLKALKEWW